MSTIPGAWMSSTRCSCRAAALFFRALRAAAKARSWSGPSVRGASTPRIFVPTCAISSTSGAPCSSWGTGAPSHRAKEKSGTSSKAWCEWPCLPPCRAGVKARRPRWSPRSWRRATRSPAWPPLWRRPRHAAPTSCARAALRHARSSSVWVPAASPLGLWTASHALFVMPWKSTVLSPWQPSKLWACPLKPPSRHQARPPRQRRLCAGAAGVCECTCAPGKTSSLSSRRRRPRSSVTIS
mmetsp:Transcript_59957/g.183240  ORF Transcript_59957/g.183240 Transcript_59957/m.183240 type:complete len:239 (-) Transcript_59957:498-1214(-)